MYALRLDEVIDNHKLDIMKWMQTWVISWLRGFSVDAAVAAAGVTAGNASTLPASVTGIDS